MPVEMPVTVHVDNMGAIFMLENKSSNKRTRHVDVRYRFVTDWIEKKLIEVVFVRTKENISDGFTKNVNKETYQNHIPHYVQERSYLKDDNIAHERDLDNESKNEQSYGGDEVD